VVGSGWTRQGRAWNDGEKRSLRPDFERVPWRKVTGGGERVVSFIYLLFIF
jgi:hypothetical protein